MIYCGQITVLVTATHIRMTYHKADIHPFEMMQSYKCSPVQKENKMVL